VRVRRWWCGRGPGGVFLWCGGGGWGGGGGGGLEILPP